MRNTVQQREEQESARVYENSSMHGQALPVVCVFPCFFCVIFYRDISCFPVMGSVYISFFFPSVDHLLNGYIC